MRRLLTLILVFAILLSTAGCKANTQGAAASQPSTTQPALEETTQPIGNIEIEQKPMYAISMCPITETSKTKGGDVICDYIYQNMALILPEPEIADKIILDYLNRMDTVSEEANSEVFLSRTEADYEIESKPFLLQMLYTPERFDASVLSLYGDMIRFSGGAHTYHCGKTVTYDLLTGETLQLTDVLCEGISADVICELVIEKLAALAEETTLFPTYEQNVQQLLSNGLEHLDYWYFSQTGLCFPFDPYNIGPFVSGTIVAEIPYAELAGILKDEYFPAEQDTYYGTLVAQKFTVEAQADFTQFAEVVLVENSTQLLLSADGALTDITVEALDIESNIATTVMAVYSLTPGDALMVEFDPATTNLLVNYRSGDQYETKTITCSQDDITVS